VDKNLFLATPINQGCQHTKMEIPLTLFFF